MALKNYGNKFKTYKCEICEEKKLNEKRNCKWEDPGECKNCGKIPFEDVLQDHMTSKYVCPICGGRVRFPTGEMVLGKSFRIPGCPVSKISELAVFLIRLVNWSEEIGILPYGRTLLEESMFYFDVRNIVVSEQSEAEKEMAPKEN